MKRIFLSLILFLITVIFPQSFVLAQATTPIPIPTQILNLPGVTCGMAGAPNGADSCCYTPEFPTFQIPAQVPDIANVKDSFNQKMNDIQQMQKTLQHACIYGSPSPPGVKISNPLCKCTLSTSTIIVPGIEKMCEKYLVSDPKATKAQNDRTGRELTACLNCARGEGLWTGIGCVPIEFSSFISDFLLRVGIGFAGVFAFFCVIYSSIQIQLSRGNPEKIKKAQEMLTSCIMGLILIIFSVFLLRVIGVNILKIPGFQ